MIRRLAARAFPGWFLRHARTEGGELGWAGERLAARHLRRAGWRLEARRLRTPAAEIDLVLDDGTALVCVEVKTGRYGTRFRPGHRLDHRQLARLWTAARWLGRRVGRPSRVDLLEVLVDARGRVRIERHAGLRRPL